MERDSCCTISDYLLLDRVTVFDGSAISRAVHMSTHKMVIVKLLDKTCFPETFPGLRKIDQFNGSFNTSISTLKKLDHDNVVKVLEGLLLNQSIPVSHGGDPFQLRSVVVMEYCYGSDLKQWLLGVQDLGHSSQLNIFSQMVDGVNYLHEQNLLHGRLQPTNVWVQGGRPMLCGFGLGHSYDGYFNENERVDFAAPECFELTYFPHPPGKKSDVFSLGILLVHLHSGRREFRRWKDSILKCCACCNQLNLQCGDPFMQLPDQHCLTNFMKRLVYLMISPVYDLRIGVELVKDMLNNEMD